MNLTTSRTLAATWCGLALCTLACTASPPARDPLAVDPAIARDNPARKALPTAGPDLQVAQLKTKSDLPPVIPSLGGQDALLLPDLALPGKTQLRPPQPVYLLAGRISGLPTRRVQALSLAGGRDHSAEVAADNTFGFVNLDPWYYQLALIGADATLVIRKVIVIEPAKPVFIRIEVRSGSTVAKIDDLSVPVEVRPADPR